LKNSQSKNQNQIVKRGPGMTANQNII